MIRNAILVAFLTGVGLLTFTRDANAYLDPGTASIILQGIIGGIAATLAVGAVYWQRVKYFFARMVGRGGDKAITTSRVEDE